MIKKRYKAVFTLIALTGFLSTGQAMSNDTGFVNPLTGDQQPVNPHMAKSHWAMTHGNAGLSDFVQVPGPTGPSRVLSAEEITWKKTGPIHSWEINYSGPYPDGTRVIWAGCHDRIVKLDSVTLDTLAELRLDGVDYWEDEAIEDYVRKTDELKGQELYDYILGILEPALPAASCNYRFIDNNNDLYTIQSPLGPGDQFLRVYGDAEPGNPKSPIVMKREWKIPAEIAPRTRGFALNMSFDGWVIMVTYSGVVFAIANDFSEYHWVNLPGSGSANVDFFEAFVRNGFPVDDEGGIYIVTGQGLNRVQWTGKRLSVDPADGAWNASYPMDPPVGRAPKGSGTTPALMGWGSQDKLVIIADGMQFRSSVLAYWRGEIPADWEGITGMDRRVAAILPITFGNDDPEMPIRTESSPAVGGYGVFVYNTEVGSIPEQKTFAGQWLAAQYGIVEPGNLPSGGMKAIWNPDTRTLDTAWLSPVSCANSVASGSFGSGMIYCFGYREGNWTLEGIDWDSGQSEFYYTLGSSHKFNIYGGIVHVAREGVIDCSCPAAMGIIRLTPKPASAGVD